MEFNKMIKAVDGTLPQEVSWPGLEKRILKIPSPAIGNSTHKQLHLTTNFVTKLSESP